MASRQRGCESRAPRPRRLCSAAAGEAGPDVGAEQCAAGLDRRSSARFDSTASAVEDERRRLPGASQPARSVSVTSRPLRRAPSSTAASMAGSTSTPSGRIRPTRAAGGGVHGEPRLEQRHPGRDAGDVPRHRADRVQAGRQRPHALERHPAVRCLQPGNAAERGRDPDRPAGVRAVGDVRLAVGNRDGGAARRPARYPVGIERVDRRAEVLVHARGAEGQLMQVDLADDRHVRRRGRPAMHGASRRRGAAASATARLPAVVGTPAMSMRSLTASRIPVSAWDSRVMNVAIPEIYPRARPLRSVPPVASRRQGARGVARRAGRNVNHGRK